MADDDFRRAVRPQGEAQRARLTRTQPYPSEAHRRHNGEGQVQGNHIQNLYSGAPSEAVTAYGGHTCARPAQHLDTTSKQSFRMVGHRSGRAGSHVGLPSTRDNLRAPKAASAKIGTWKM